MPSRYSHSLKAFTPDLTMLTSTLNYHLAPHIIFTPMSNQILYSLKGLPFWGMLVSEWDCRALLLCPWLFGVPFSHSHILLHSDAR